MATTGKIAEVLFEQALETYEEQSMMINMVDFFNPDSGDMQNSSAAGDGTAYPYNYSGGAVWRPVEQHAPIIDGWDLSAVNELDIIEETYPALLGIPKNDWIEQRADDLRDMRFWERRGVASGKRQVAELNSLIANAIEVQGSVFFEFDLSAATTPNSGYEAIATAQTMLNERQKGKAEERFVVLNDRDNLIFSSELAGRQTLQGRPAETWNKGQIGENVAGFDVYTGSFLSSLAQATIVNGAVGTVSGGGGGTCTGGESLIPEAGTVNQATGVVTNVDYRTGTINVTDATGVAMGDKITVSGVNAVGMHDKTDTGELMTFTVISVAANAITVYPKPISATLVDATAENQTLWRAYANCTGDLTAGTVALVNSTAGTHKHNIFGCRSAIEVTGGDAPLQLLNEFSGMKVISSTMSNGQVMYMAYDGNLETLTFRCRLFTWHGVTVADPSACGSFVTVP